MSKKLDILLRLGLSAALTQRDTFVSKVAEVLEEKMGTDPDKAEKIGEDVMSYVADLKDEMFLRSLFDSSSDSTEGVNNEELSAKIDELTKAINNLTDNMKK